MDTNFSKVCYACGEAKGADGFHRSKDRYDGVSSRCKDCTRAYAREYNQRLEIKKRKEGYYSNPENRRRLRLHQYKYQLKKLYGLSWERYEEMEWEQGGVCKICKGRPYDAKSFLSVDHCHATGVIQGLLCDGCNNMLARASDNADVLRRAAEYLDEFTP